MTNVRWPQIENETESGGKLESTLSSILKRNVDKFVKNTNTLISALDKVANTHSVIQGT